MRILLVPCTFTCLNMGDVSLLEVVAQRLRASWPEATIYCLTKDRAALAAYCPELEPLDYGSWYSDHYLLGGLHNKIPEAVSRSLVGMRQGLRRRAPDLDAWVVDLKARLRHDDVNSFRILRRAVKEADVVVVSGAGGITDTFPVFSKMVLNMLEMAIHRGVPAAMFSHGLGPLCDPELLAWARRVLPRVDLIALREKMRGPRILESLGVDPGRVMITGDDAVGTAFEARRSELGSGIGVNLRVQAAAAVEGSDINAIRPELQAFATKHHAELVPAPIARQGGLDANAIRQLLAGYNDLSDGGQDLDTPLKVIEQIGRCRIVVTGAYHAAVFALSQGIPAVCLARSTYFVDKLEGLADLFGPGCQVIPLDDPHFRERFREGMESAWQSADQLRSSLLQAAAQQVEMSKDAYRRFDDLMAARCQAASTRSPAPVRTKAKQLT